jgi:hypothetical protein
MANSPSFQTDQRGRLLRETLLGKAVNIPVGTLGKVTEVQAEGKLRVYFDDDRGYVSGLPSSKVEPA